MFVIVAVVIVVGNIATSASLSGVNLDCTNDYEYRMSCHFDAPNCTEYNVTLRSLDGYGETHCLPVQCASEKCCCSIRMLLILDENHTAFVRRRGEYVESKNISVKYSFKPQTPSIVSVNETNGNFQVIWRTNINKHHIREIISTLLTYRKKGETEEMTEVVKAPQVETQLCFLCFTSEILGAHLEPNTTYVVTAQNLLPWESQPSDRSEEYEFTTPASRESLLLTLIITLSLLAITISSGAYVCYVKAKYWDSVSSQNSKLLNIYPSKEEVLKPMPPIISSIYVETLTPGDLKPWSKGSLIDSSTESLLQSSGISSGPSSLSYACTEAADIIAGVQGAVSKALMNIVPASASTNHLLKESSKPNGVLSTRPSPCNSEQHSGCENAVTYSFIRPVHVIPETLKSHAQSQLPFECGYQSTGSGSTCDDKRGSACEENSFPTLVSSYTLTPASRQQANRDSGKFSIGENSDASLSCSNTSLSGDVESRMETGHEGCQEMFISGACGKGEDATKEGKALLCIPASLQGHFPVDDNYQVHRCLKELRDRPFEDETHLKNQDLSKALENYSKDATKSDTGFRAHSNHSFLVDDNYQPVQYLRELADSQIGEPKSSKKTLDNIGNLLYNVRKSDTCVPTISNFSCLVDDNYQVFQGGRELSNRQFGQQNSGNTNDLKKTFDNSFEGVCVGDTCSPANSNPSFPVDDNCQAFHGLGEHSDHQVEVGEKKSVENECLLKDVGKPFKDLSQGDQGHTCIPLNLQGSLPVDDNYQVCRGIRELSDRHFGEQNGEKGLEEPLENSLQDAPKGNSRVPASSNSKFCTEENYLPFHGLRQHSDQTAGEPSSGEKDDLAKVFDTPLKDVRTGVQCSTCVPAILQDSLPVDDNYQVFRGLRNQTDLKVPGQISGTKDDWVKVLKTTYDDAAQGDNLSPESLQDSLQAGDHCKVIQALSKQCDSKFAEHKEIKKKDLREAFEISLPVMPGGPSGPVTAVSTDHVHGRKHLPESQMPFLPSVSTALRNHMIIESGYKIV
ncbi:uncharacterized protein il4r.2 isoform X2 [Hippocampus comes]|uniref:uncharacterized protein il4r.2 isoform X2 n=1 Tax=Hippocampus comes TaxID=109280 RepID=UPI00094F1357|nr:PREDICTED: uncharacterized protein LOC109528403 isoform X2 [Hippocampus comes]